jgi:RHS repeat-associated protein
MRGLGRGVSAAVVVAVAIGSAGLPAAAEPAARVAYPEPSVFEATESSPVVPTGAGAVERAPAAEVERVGELVEHRSETTATYELSDGTLETVLSAGPMHVEVVDGEFEPVDTGLVADGNEGWSPATTSYEVVLPAVVDGTLAFSVDAGDIEVVLDTEALVAAAEEAAPSAAVAEERADEPAVSVEGEVADASVTYAGVVEGVDLVLTAMPDAVKEEVVLADASVPREFSWLVSVPAGLSARLTAEDEVEIVDAEGAVVAFMPAPFMVDASGEEDARSSELEVTLTPEGDRWRYGLVADDGWLDARERVWPVTIDPTIRETPFFDCTIVSGTQANTNYCASTGLRVGRTSSGWIRRSLLRFDFAYYLREFDVLPANIMAAELSLRVGPDVNTRFLTALYGMDEHWNNGATWNRRTGSASWSTAGGGAVVTIPGSTGGEQGGNSGNTMWGADPARQYWYPTDLVQRWADGDQADHGFQLRALDESLVREMQFHSSETSRWQDYPQLKVQWSRGIGDRAGYSWTQDTSVTDRSSYRVNPGTGNLMVGATDLTLPGKAGHDLGVERFYNSLHVRQGDHHDVDEEHIGDFGAGWSSTLDSRSRLRFYSGSNLRIVYKDPSGWAQSFYDRTNSGVFRSPRRTDVDIRRLDTGHFEATNRQTKVVERFAANGRLLSLRDGYNNRLLFSYDSNLRITSVADTRGGGVTVTRNAAGLVTRLVDHTGRQFRYGYSGNRLVSYTDPEGGVTRYVHDTSGQLSRITDPLGAHHDFTHRSSVQQHGGAVATVKRPRANTTVSYDYSYSLDSDAPEADAKALRQVSVTDARGHRTRHYGDARGRVVKTIDPEGTSATTGFNTFDNVLNFTSSEGGQPTNSSYSSDGRFLQSISSPSGSAYEFDGYPSNDEFRPGQLTTPQQGQISYTYDSAGGNLDSITDQAGGVTRVNRDQQTRDGFVISMVTPKGGTTTFHPTSDGKRLVDRVTTPNNARDVQKITYDAAYRPITVRDGRGRTTTYGYDHLDRVTEIVYDGGSRVVYDYDLNGRRVSRTDPTGTVVTTFDADGNITSETYPAPRGQQTYAYDLNGNMTRHTDAAGNFRIDYAYDRANRLERVTEPAVGGTAQMTSYAYHQGSNNLRSVTFPASTGVVQRYEYDVDDRIEDVRAVRGSTVLTRATYDYKHEGSLRERMTWFDGTTTRVTTYGYDSMDRLDAATTPGRTDYAYLYDANSNRTRQTVTPHNGTAQVTAYAYDAADRLCRSRTGSTSLSCSTSTGLSSVTGYDHDGNGNMTGSTAGLVLAYNDANQTWAMGGLEGQGGTFASYAGVGQTERVSAHQRTFTTALHGVTAARQGTAVTRWVRDPGGNLVSQRGADGSRAYYLTDGLGSTVALIDADGQVRTRYAYSPYGETEQTCHGAGCIDNPWRYTGEYQDPTGFYKIGERYLSPELGRWTQADPAANRINPTMPGEPNPYAYAACDPINNTDPTGLVPLGAECVAAFLGSIVGTGSMSLALLYAVITAAYGLPVLAAVGAVVFVAEGILTYQSVSFLIGRCGK